MNQEVNTDPRISPHAKITGDSVIAIIYSPYLDAHPGFSTTLPAVVVV
jgi:hypothetical protein